MLLEAFQPRWSPWLPECDSAPPQRFPYKYRVRIVLQGMDGGGMLRSHVNSPNPLQCNQGASQCPCLPMIPSAVR